MPARILIIESDVLVAAALEGLLTSAGHEVTRADSVSSGLERAAQAKWDLVLLGLQEDELPGAAVARVLVDLGGTAVGVMSAGAVARWRREAFAAGAAAFLDKTFDPGTLLALLDAIVVGSASGPGMPGNVAALGTEDLARIRRMSDAELDALPFGLMRVDRDGVITAFNAFEGRTAGYERAAVVGRPFGEIAPCTKVKEFAGLVAQGFADRSLDRVLRFVFPVHAAECVVSVRLFYDDARDQMWIFVSRRSGGPPSEPARTAGGRLVPG